MSDNKKTSGSFFAGDKPEGKFMALYSDGSGGQLYMSTDSGYINAEGDEVDYDFIEIGYAIWVSIPDEYKFWFEQE